MKYNYQFIEIGQLHESHKGWTLSIQTESKKFKETFPSLDLALKNVESHVKQIHKQNDVPVSIKYERTDGTITWICYNADSKPKEYAAFDYLGFNTAFHEVPERRTYMTPRNVSYNSIARVASAEKVRDRRIKNVIDSILFIFWGLFLALIIKYSFFPSNEAKGAANQFGLEYNNPIAWGAIVGGFVAVLAFLIADNIPRIMFWKKSNEGTDSKNVRAKFYSENKDWKSYYRARHLGNVWAMLFLGIAFVLLVVAAVFLGTSVYSQFNLNLDGTKALVALLIIAIISLAIEATLKVFAFLQNAHRRELALSRYVNEEMKPYFKAWTSYKGIKNEELKFRWEVFVYPQSKEELEKSYLAIKQNMMLPYKQKREIKKSLIKDLQKAFDKIKAEKNPEKPKKEKVAKAPKIEKDKVAKAPKAKPAKVAKQPKPKKEKVAKAPKVKKEKVAKAPKAKPAKVAKQPKPKKEKVAKAKPAKAKNKKN